MSVRGGIYNPDPDALLFPVQCLQVAKSDSFMRMLKAMDAEKRLDRVVVDECHCVSVGGGEGGRDDT